ncbi:MAG: J domain-containing protein [Candidatus Nitrohelix vancouverensis]|uniref:J domain-containing protein n=1 Tax=Candidatus Nitrohelix vancouverensis TaxID=2705534 RepID=A0A7T0G3D3_9BACT|nr:MAG: J domain-containing protein [Candidatus Nitrohelix vancouverensis]
MIKRLFDIAKANWGDWRERQDASADPSRQNFTEQDYFQPESPPPRNAQSDRLAGFYANLELQPGATKDEVKKAWRRLMKQYHPDLHSQDPQKKQVAEELTQRLTEAYHTLNKELSK